MMKMSFTNNQTAFEYALYMIAASYFSKTECVNPLLERKMRFQFMEQKSDNQYKMEDICIGYMDRILRNSLPEKFWHQKVKVNLVADPQTGRTQIQFVGHGFILRLKGEYKGKNSEITHELWKKRKPRKAVLSKAA